MDLVAAGDPAKARQGPKPLPCFQAPLGVCPPDAREVAMMAVGEENPTAADKMLDTCPVVAHSLDLAPSGPRIQGCLQLCLGPRHQFSVEVAGEGVGEPTPDLGSGGDAGIDEGLAGDLELDMAQALEPDFGLGGEALGALPHGGAQGDGLGGVSPESLEHLGGLGGEGELPEEAG